jgi:hypothetical protein
MARKRKRAAATRAVREEIATRESRSFMLRLAQLGMLPLLALVAVASGGVALLLAELLEPLLGHPRAGPLVFLGLIVIAVLPPTLTLLRLRNLHQSLAYERLAKLEATLRLKEEEERIAASPEGQADGGLSIAAVDSPGGALALHDPEGALTLASPHDDDAAETEEAEQPARRG